MFADPLAAARDYARQLASRNPQAIRNAKALTSMAQPASPESLLAERRAMWETIGTPTQIEAVRANLEHRSPSYEDRSGQFSKQAGPGWSTVE